MPLSCCLPSYSLAFFIRFTPLCFMAALILVVPCSFALSFHALPLKYDIIFNALQKDLVGDLLSRLGVRLTLVPASSSTGLVSGRWDSSSLSIYLYLHDDSVVGDYYAVLYHEAVHVAQFCLGMKSGYGRPVPLGLFTDDSSREAFRFGRELGYYRAGQSDLESEAYALESRPSDVYTFLSLHCSD